MTQRPVIDAGPALNFLSINKASLLIGVLGKLSAPEAVQGEVLRKAAQDTRFRAAELAWKRLTPTYIEVLSDDPTDELARVVNRITSQRMDERVKQSQDLGETMVIGHAVVAAEAGAEVIVLIDDGRGAQTATREKNRLDRLRAAGRPVGSIRLVSSLTIMENAAGTIHLPGKSEMREIYRRLRGLDDGLPPIEKTELLTTLRWTADYDLS